MAFSTAPNIRQLKYTLYGVFCLIGYPALAAVVYLTPLPDKVFGIPSFTVSWAILIGLALIMALAVMAKQFDDRRAKPLVQLAGSGFVFVAGFHVVLFVYYLGKLGESFPLWSDGKINRALIAAVWQFFITYKMGLLGPTILIVGCILMFVFARWRFTIDSEDGTGKLANAHVAKVDEMDKAGLYTEDGALIGRDKATKKILRSPKFSHRLIIAPTESGKDAGVIIPVLLTENRPFIAFDTKFEYSSVTKRARETMGNGREVVVLDPFKVGQDQAFLDTGYEYKEQFFNPLTFINEQIEKRAKDINALTKALVVRAPSKSSTDTGQHFEELVEVFIRSTLHHLMDDYFTKSKADSTIDHPTLHDLFTLAGLPKEPFIDLCKDLARRYPELMGPQLNLILRLGEDELGSFGSTILRQLDWITDPNMRDFIKRTSFKLEDLFNNEIDIFVSVPEDQVATHMRFVRLIFQLGIVKLQQLSPAHKPARRVCFLVNEAGLLGYMDFMEKAYNIIRGRGGVIWWVFQNKAQMKEYPLADAFESAPIKHVFGTNDAETIKWVGDLAGEKTVMTESFTQGDGRSASGATQVQTNTSVSGNRSVTVSEQRTKLFKPEDLQYMPAGEQVVFVKGLPPIVCERLNYFDEKMFAGLYDEYPVEKFQST